MERSSGDKEYVRGGAFGEMPLSILHDALACPHLSRFHEGENIVEVVAALDPRVGRSATVSLDINDDEIEAILVL